MIIMNLQRLFAIRGIEKPFKYLMSKGVSYNRAYRLTRGQFHRYDNKIIEEVCYALNCTPNDIFQFIPNKEHLKDEKLELHKLKKIDDVAFDIKGMLRDTPVEELKSVFRQLKEMKKEQG